MQEPKDFVRIVNKKRYSVKSATLIASDCYWDGHNFERNGTNTWLYKTAKGAYFTVTLSQWQGAQDTLEPVSQAQAIEMFEDYLSEHEVSYKEAFPDVVVVDA